MIWVIIVTKTTNKLGESSFLCKINPTSYSKPNKIFGYWVFIIIKIIVQNKILVECEQSMYFFSVYQLILSKGETGLDLIFSSGLPVSEVRQSVISKQNNNQWQTEGLKKIPLMKTSLRSKKFALANDFLGQQIFKDPKE